ncbi:hypothetical protein RUM43_003346 [Polyplax serrata]|uniref:Uncharacterized protein n=1 Tax=Polyplax serrata TaxID=468196 RepID=A0AAN8S6G6_POLSC
MDTSVPDQGEWDTTSRQPKQISVRPECKALDNCDEVNELYIKDGDVLGDNPPKIKKEVCRCRYTGRDDCTSGVPDASPRGHFPSPREKKKHVTQFGYGQCKSKTREKASMSTEREIDRTKQKVPRRCCAIAMAMGAEKLGGVRTRANFSTQNSLLSVGGKIL